MLLLKYRTYNRGATAQTLSAGGPGLIAPGGTPGKIKWPELGVTELRFRDRLDPAEARRVTEKLCCRATMSCSAPLARFCGAVDEVEPQVSGAAAASVVATLVAAVVGLIA